MAAIFTVIRGTGFNISHSMGVADNLLVIATGGALFGGIWIWLSRQATVGTTAPATGRRTTDIGDSTDSPHISVGADLTDVDRGAVEWGAVLTH